VAKTYDAQYVALARMLDCKLVSSFEGSHGLELQWGLANLNLRKCGMSR
jgi:hypothetical protein